MSVGQVVKPPKRKDDRIIIHFDYDCFYASVFEAENPALKSLPLAVQQKQLVVTCNYEARQRGLHKLQLITEAKKRCSDVVIVLGEDLTRFRDASKELYAFISWFSWNQKAEKLGFDEVWIDVTDAVDYNIEVLNRNDLKNGFFQLDKTDPTSGFPFDASVFAGHTWPEVDPGHNDSHDALKQRLILGSHLADHIRHQLEEQKGYTATVGISTSRLLSKLVGNVNKPKSQTTLVPPYQQDVNGNSNVRNFLDEHEVGKIPWIGFKLAQKLRERVLGRPAEFNMELVYGGTKEVVTVSEVRNFSNFSPAMLERVLGGPGTPHGIGSRVFGLLHGVDDTEVAEARNVPKQISIEDSYTRLDTQEQALLQLTSLSRRLIERVRIDLTETDDEDEENDQQSGHNAFRKRKWIAHPTTLRLSIRPRLGLNPDGTRIRSFKRISRSCPLPNFMFSLPSFEDDRGVIDESSGKELQKLTGRLVQEALLPLFRKLHPEKSGWNLSLVNVAVTGMADESRGANGQNIKRMFRQVDVLTDVDGEEHVSKLSAFQDVMDVDEDGHAFQDAANDEDMAADHTRWSEESDEEENEIGYECEICGAFLPSFASAAHMRFHAMEE